MTNMLTHGIPRHRSWSPLLIGIWCITSSLVLLIRAPVAQAGLQRPSLTLISQSSAVSGVEKATFQLSLDLSPAIVTHLDSTSRLVVTSHRPITSRQEIHEAVAGNLPQIIDQVAFPLDDIITGDARPGSARIVTLPVHIEIGTRTADALQMSATGVYPLTIGYETSGQPVVTLVSFIERLPAGTLSTPSGGVPVDANGSRAPLKIAILGRVSAPLSLNEDSSVTIDQSNRTTLASYVATAERRPDVPLTLVPQPEFLDAFSRSTSADQDVLIRLQRISSIEFLSDTYVHMDPTLAQSRGLNNIFTRQLRLGESTIAALFPSSAAPRLTWLQSAHLSAGGARTLADLGFRTVILTARAQVTAPQTLFDDVDGEQWARLAFADAQLSSGNDGIIGAALIDRYLSAALTEGSFRPDGGERLVAQQILADLEILHSQISSTSGTNRFAPAVLLSTDSGELPSPAMLDALIDVISQDSRFALTNVDSVLAELASSGRSVDIDLPAPADPREAATTNDELVNIIRDLDSSIDAYASVLPANNDRTRRWRRLVDVIADDRLSSTDVRRFENAIRSDIAAISSAVVPPSSTTFTLGGRESPIRFTIRNDSDDDLSVLVRLRSSKLRFPEPDKVVVLPANTSTAVDVPVSARTNGRFPVTLQLLTPQGQVPLGPPATLTARVNALAGLGQLVTGIALLLLASWWANHLRREHRRKQTEADTSIERHPSG